MADRAAKRARRQRVREHRQGESRKTRRRNLIRTVFKATGGLAVVALLIGGIVLYSITRKELPPTGFGPTHSESLPPQQINIRPIPRPVQEHVMERNLTHPAGRMLVEYNCEDYECEPDLVERLVEMVRSYPPSVYLAPYPGMDAKIALAAPGRLLTLETLDEDRIREFINRNLNR